MLIDLIRKISVEYGYNLADSGVKPLLIDRINEAAQEIYESRDLPGCLREQLFYVGTNNQQIALPSNAEKLRGIRLPQYCNYVSLQDMRPRYQNKLWTCPMMNWRLKGQSPIQRDIVNAGPLTLTLPLAETSGVTVNLIYKTVKSNRLQENVIFAIGQTSKQTVNSPVEIFTVRNSASHLYDITVLDMDGNVLAVLGNNEVETKYNIVQILDYPYTNGSGITNEQSLVEVLYKLKFMPFINDHDDFICGSAFDKAIYWKFKEHDFSRQDGKLVDIVASSEKCSIILSELTQDTENHVDREMTFGNSKFFGGGVEGNDSFWRDPYQYPCSASS